MSFPVIAVKSKVGKQVARTLGMSPEKLDRADGSKDGMFLLNKLSTITFYGKQDPTLVALSKRVIHPSYFIPGPFYLSLRKPCHHVFFVDNGDGKIGRGDLFLHADGWYKVKAKSGWYKGTMASTYRFASLFKPRKVQSLSGYKARNSANLTPEADKIAKAVEALKGTSWKNAKVKTAITAICKR